jgi:hypothetical protein
METLELNVAKRAIVKTRHVILVRALVLLVDVNVYIYIGISCSTGMYQIYLATQYNFVSI